MRTLFYSVVVAAAVTSACNRAESPAPNDAAPGTATSDSGNSGAPVATSGTSAAADSDRSTFGSLFKREPEFREITIPAGTRLPVTLDSAVGSDISRVEERVQAHTSRAVTVDDVAVVPAGSEISGVVTDATASAKVKGRAHVAMRFDTLVPEGADFAGERYAIQTAPVDRTAPGTKKEDAVKIGAPAAGGAIVGAIVGGKKGAAIGTAVGGGAGTAMVLSTRGDEVRLGRGAALTLELSEPVTIRIRAAR